MFGGVVFDRLPLRPAQHRPAKVREKVLRLAVDISSYRLEGRQRGENCWVMRWAASLKAGTWGAIVFCAYLVFWQLSHGDVGCFTGLRVLFKSNFRDVLSASFFIFGLRSLLIHSHLAPWFMSGTAKLHEGLGAAERREGPGSQSLTPGRPLDTQGDPVAIKQLDDFADFPEAKELRAQIREEQRKLEEPEEKPKEATDGRHVGF